MKKRSMYLLVMTALLVVLTACGGEKETGGTVAPPAEPEAPVAGTMEAAAEEAFQPGEMNGGVYTNEFLGIGCTLDSNWTYLTDEEIAELNRSTTEQLSDEEMRAAMEDASLQDMFAQADGGLVNISITIENLGVLHGTAMDEARFLEILRPTVETAFTDIGMTGLVMEASTETFVGESHAVMNISGTLEADVPFYQKVVLIKRGTYMASVSIGSAMENITADIAALFYKLDT